VPAYLASVKAAVAAEKEIIATMEEEELEAAAAKAKAKLGAEAAAVAEKAAALACRIPHLW